DRHGEGWAGRSGSGGAWARDAAGAAPRDPRVSASASRASTSVREATFSFASTCSVWRRAVDGLIERVAAISALVRRAARSRATRVSWRVSPNRARSASSDGRAGPAPSTAAGISRAATRGLIQGSPVSATQAASKSTSTSSRPMLEAAPVPGRRSAARWAARRRWSVRVVACAAATDPAPWRSRRPSRRGAEAVGRTWAAGKEVGAGRPDMRRRGLRAAVVTWPHANGRKGVIVSCDHTILLLLVPPPARGSGLRGAPGVHEPLADGLRHGGAAGVHVELLVDVLDVRVDRARADEEALGDLLLRVPGHHLAEHVALALGEPVVRRRPRPVERGEHLPRDGPRHQHAAVAGGLDRRRELVGVGVLEEVARGARPAGGVDRPGVVAGGEHDDARPGEARLEGAEAVEPAHAGEVDVEEEDVGPVRVGGPLAHRGPREGVLDAPEDLAHVGGGGERRLERGAVRLVVLDDPDGGGRRRGHRGGRRVREGRIAPRTASRIV